MEQINYSIADCILTLENEQTFSSKTELHNMLMKNYVFVQLSK